MINFKQFLIELADYGFNSNPRNKPMGGTEIVQGDELYDVVNTSEIMSELVNLPPLGQNYPNQKWESMIEWGTGPGAIQVECTTLGSLKLITRRKISDLEGEDVWICKNVRPLSDVDDQHQEIRVANEVHDVVADLSEKMIDAPAQEFDDFERLAWRMWAGVKKEYPSYCMFPVTLRKQNENYYKMIFEFKGAGAGNIADGGSIKQFDIDLFWDDKKGLIRCWGYNIDSPTKKSAWNLNPSEWNEYFSPAQEKTEIIESVVSIFMQY